MLEQPFDLKGHGTSVRTELLAGLATFLTMACIAVVNPAMLAGGDGYRCFIRHQVRVSGRAR